MKREFLQIKWECLGFYALALLCLLPLHPTFVDSLLPPKPHSSDTPLHVFIAGDILLGRGTSGSLAHGETPLQLLAPVSRLADSAFCNLECVLMDRSGKASKQNRHSRHPFLLAPTDAARYLADAGIDVVSVANNHALDGGEYGAETTLTALQSVGIQGIGSTRDSDQWPVYRKMRGGHRIAWLAASAYGPWQAGKRKIRNISGTGLLQQVHSLSQSGDIVFVSLHWGEEYSRAPTLGEIQVAHRLIDAGAAVIAGHHPHVAQRIEIYKGKPIFYSLGNFVFDHLPGRAQNGFAADISVFPDGAIKFHVLSLKIPKTLNVPREVGPVRTTPLPQGERLIKMLPGHFRGSPQAAQRVVWSRGKGKGDILRVYERQSGGWHCLAEGHHPSIKDLQVGDVDSDGYDEVVLCLHQRSKLDIRSADRLYIYAVGPSGIFQPRWRGSGLSRPFLRFWLLPMGTGCDLVALEKDSLAEYQNFEWLSIYRWNGFGLRRLWNTPVRGLVKDLKTGRDEHGVFVTFVQVRQNSKRALMLRPSTDARVLTDDIEPYVTSLAVNHKIPLK